MFQIQSQIGVTKEKSVKKEEHSLNDFGSVKSAKSAKSIKEADAHQKSFGFGDFEEAGNSSQLSASIFSKIEPAKEAPRLNPFASEPFEQKSIKSAKKDEHSLNDFMSVHSDHLESSMHI